VLFKGTAGTDLGNKIKKAADLIKSRKSGARGDGSSHNIDLKKVLKKSSWSPWLSAKINSPKPKNQTSSLISGRFSRKIVVGRRVRSWLRLSTRFCPALLSIRQNTVSSTRCSRSSMTRRLSSRRPKRRNDKTPTMEGTTAAME